jgi:hypothetical protein
MVKAWLDSRTPPPPERLARRLEEALQPDFDDADAGAMVERLTLAAVSILSGLEQDRSSALDLLAADALISYALEAAAEDCVSFAASTDAMIARLAALTASVGGTH